MRKFVFILSLILASAAQAYDNTWYTTEFWSGEWPNGFSVAERGVVVTGRTGMAMDLPRSVQCELPYKALFNPWNEARNQVSHVHYWTASKIVKMIAVSDFRLPGDQGIEVKSGTTIEYLIYGAEGMFIVRVNGKEYAADQELFDHVSPSAEEIQSQISQDEWLQLTCARGNIAWIRYSDLFTTQSDGTIRFINGIWRASIGSPGVTEYGHARDLTEEDIRLGNR